MQATKANEFKDLVMHYGCYREPLICDRSPNFQAAHLNRNFTQFRPSEIYYRPSPTAQNGSLEPATTRNVKDLSQVCFDSLENQF